MALPFRLGPLALFATTAVIACNRSSSEPPSTGKQLLTIGAIIPDVTGVDQLGREHHLPTAKGRPLLVYFYPKDGTPGCTKEACAFRDVWTRFEEAQVTLYGVSRDDRASHEKFAREHRIPFSLIADEKGVWANAFGVPSTNGKSARVSFLFDARGRVARVYPNVDPGIHADQVLRDVAALP